MALAQTDETPHATITRSANLTSSDSDEDGHLEFLLADSIFMVIMAVQSILGIGGNALVLMCLFKDQKLRTMANYLLAHLALVNFAYSVLVLPSQASMYGNYSGLACVIIAVFGVVLFMMSLHSQLVISFNRFMLVAKPLEVYTKWFSTKMVTVLLSFFWLFDTVVYFVVPAIIVDFEVTHLPEHGICLFYTPDYQYILAMSPVTWLSFALSLCFYVALIVYVRKNSVAFGHRARKDIKASVVLLVIMALYLVTYNVIPKIMAAVNDHELPPELTTRWINGFVEILQWLNFCVSPIIYGLTIKEFRITYTKLICPFRKVHPSNLETSASSTGGFRTSEQ